MKKALFLILILLFPSVFLMAKEMPVAYQGVLDLREWDFDQDGIVRLDGDWEFRWKKLETDRTYQLPEDETVYAKIPGLWRKQSFDDPEVNTFGYTTYHLLVRLPEEKNIYAIRTGGIATSFKMYADGVYVASDGVVGRSKKESVPRMMLENGVISHNGGDLLLTLQVSNYFHVDGGVWQSIKLGNYHQIKREDRLAVSLDLLQFGAILVVGLHYLGVYFFRRKENHYLMFGMICLIFALRVLLLDTKCLIQLFPEIPWEVEYSLNYLTFYILPALYVMFISWIFPAKYNRFVIRFFFGTATVGVLINLFSDPLVFSSTRGLFQINVILACSYVIYLILFATKEQKKEALVFIIGATVFLGLVVNDVLHSNYVIQTGNFSGVGLVIFFLSVSYFLTKKFSVAFNLVEKQNVELLQIRTELEEKNRKLSSLDQLKDEFLATTSHELKTPLHGMIGIAESMRDSSLSREIHQRLQLIISSGKRLSNLVQGILDFSKMKSNDLKLKQQMCDLHGMVGVILVMLNPLIRDREKVKLVNQIPKGLFVFADENRLEQIFYNLIGNAIKFTEDGNITVSAEKVDNKIRILVKDTGAGIPEERQKNIFNAYETLEKSGTGLGLTITRELVELQSGKIWLNSDQNGTSFYVELPGKELENYQPPEIEPMVFDMADMPKSDELNQIVPENEFEILVVDDEPVNVQVVHSQLASLYHVTTRYDGKSALEYLEEKKPDLVLLDVMMPGLNGFETCQKIREIYSENELPVIFLTVKNQLMDLIEGFNAGGNDYLTKPFSHDELLIRIKNQLSQVTTKSRIETLSQLSYEIDNFDSKEQLFDLALKVLKSDRLISAVSLKKDEQIIFHSEGDGDVVTSEPTESQKLTPDMNVYQAEIFDDYQLMCLLEEESDENLEFLRAIVNQIRLKKKALESRVPLEEIPQEVISIFHYLKRIQFVKSERQYCRLFMEDGNEEFLRISLKNILKEVSETQLIQVHRSYLVSPDKIDKVVSMSKSSYEIHILKQKIPATGKFIEPLKGLRPDLF